MSNLFNHRRETYGLEDRLDDINDTRNGILLYRGFHGNLDTGDVAFLMVCDLLSVPVYSVQLKYSIDT